MNTTIGLLLVLGSLGMLMSCGFGDNIFSKAMAHEEEYQSYEKKTITPPYLLMI